MFGCLKISSPIYITVGQGGRGGTGVALGKGEDGQTGTASTIQTQYEGVTYTLTAGSGTGGEGGNNGNKGGTAGTCSFTPQLIDNVEQYKIIGQYPGSPGSSRRTPASEQNGKEAVYNHWLKPEGGSFTRPGGVGGSSKDEAGYGGGGGASVLEMEQMGPTKTMVSHQLHMGLVAAAAATMSDVSTTEGQVLMVDLFCIIRRGTWDKNTKAH